MTTVWPIGIHWAHDVNGDSPDAQTLARAAVASLIDAKLTVATAESLTGGLVAASLTSVPGASACFRGGIVSYATDLKSSLLGVDSALLAEAGPVDEQVALQMAAGACVTCGSHIGVATTGVAGPTEQDGVPVGTVFVAVWSHARQSGSVQRLQLHGDRGQIRAQAVEVALELANGASRSIDDPHR